VHAAEQPASSGRARHGAFHQLLNEQQWNMTRLDAVIEQKQVGLFLLGLFLQNFQRQLGENVGVRPGAEMWRRAGRQEAHIPVALLGPQCKC